MTTTISTGLSAALAGQSPRKAANTMASLFGAGYTVQFIRNGTAIVTATGATLVNNARDGIWMKGETVTGSMTIDGTWSAHVFVTSAPTIYADIDLSAEGSDGWIRAALVSGASLSWSIVLRASRTIPDGVFPLSLWKNKWGGWDQMAIPAVDQAIVGQMQTSRLIKLYDVVDDITGSQKFNAICGSGYSSDVEVSINAGAWQSLSGSPSYPITDGDTVQFRAPAVASAGAGNTKTIYMSGAATPPSPFLQWYFVLANTGGGVTHTVGTGQTYATPEAICAAGVLKAGDIVDLLGEDFPGFKVRQSGALGSEITFRTKPGESRRALITHTLGYGQAFENPGQQLEHARYLVWGENLASHIKFQDIDVIAGRGVASDRTARFAFEQRGHNWIYERVKIYDSLMGFHSSDYYSGSMTSRLCWLDNVGQLSSFNSHPIYINADVQAWPDLLTLNENNLITRASGQGVALRSCYSITRNNWIEMDQSVSDPNAEAFWTITPDGLGGYNYTSGPQGTGVAGQFCVMASGPEQRENNTLYRRPVHQIYGNFCRGSINTGTLGAGGDSTGFNGYSNSYVAHNTIFISAARSPYIQIFRPSRTPHAIAWDNNLVAVDGGVGMSIESTWANFNIDTEAQWPYQIARNNCLPSSSYVYWVLPAPDDAPSLETVGRYLHQLGTIWHGGAPLTNHSAGAYDITPASGSCVIGAARSLTYTGAISMPAYAAPIDLARRVWTAKPTFPFSAPAAGSATTNVGAA